MKFRRFLKAISKKLKNKKFAKTKISGASDFLSILIGSQNVGWQFSRNGVEFFVGKEGDYWLANYDDGDGISIDLIEHLGVAIGRGGVSRRVDEAGLADIIEWIDKNILR